MATSAPRALAVAVYEPQCGAKVFRVNDNLVAAIETPFRSSWSFDVRLGQRLSDGTGELPGLPVSSFLEMPLDEWNDVAGSEVGVLGSAVALCDVPAIGLARRWGSRRRRQG